MADEDQLSPFPFDGASSFFFLDSHAQGLGLDEHLHDNLSTLIDQEPLDLLSSDPNTAAQSSSSLFGAPGQYQQSSALQDQDNHSVLIQDSPKDVEEGQEGETSSPDKRLRGATAPPRGCVACTPGPGTAGIPGEGLPFGGIPEGHLAGKPREALASALGAAIKAASKELDEVQGALALKVGAAQKELESVRAAVQDLLGAAQKELSALQEAFAHQDREEKGAGGEEEDTRNESGQAKGIPVKSEERTEFCQGKGGQEEEEEASAVRKEAPVESQLRTEDLLKGFEFSPAKDPDKVILSFSEADVVFDPAPKRARLSQNCRAPLVELSPLLVEEGGEDTPGLLLLRNLLPVHAKEETDNPRAVAKPIGIPPFYPSRKEATGEHNYSKETVPTAEALLGLMDNVMGTVQQLCSLLFTSGGSPSDLASLLVPQPAVGQLSSGVPQVSQGQGMGTPGEPGIEAVAGLLGAFTSLRQDPDLAVSPQIITQAAIPVSSSLHEGIAHSRGNAIGTVHLEPSRHANLTVSNEVSPLLDAIKGLQPPDRLRLLLALREALSLAASLQNLDGFKTQNNPSLEAALPGAVPASASTDPYSAAQAHTGASISASATLGFGSKSAGGMPAGFPRMESLGSNKSSSMACMPRMDSIGSGPATSAGGAPVVTWGQGVPSPLLRQQGALLSCQQEVLSRAIDSMTEEERLGLLLALERAKASGDTMAGMGLLCGKEQGANADGMAGQLGRSAVVPPGGAGTLVGMSGIGALGTGFAGRAVKHEFPSEQGRYATARPSPVLVSHEKEEEEDIHYNRKQQGLLQDQQAQHQEEHTVSAPPSPKLDWNSFLEIFNDEEVHGGEKDSKAAVAAVVEREGQAGVSTIRSADISTLQNDDLSRAADAGSELLALLGQAVKVNPGMTMQQLGSFLAATQIGRLRQTREVSSGSNASPGVPGFGTAGDRPTWRPSGVRQGQQYHHLQEQLQQQQQKGGQQWKVQVGAKRKSEAEATPRKVAYPRSTTLPKPSDRLLTTTLFRSESEGQTVKKATATVQEGKRSTVATESTVAGGATVTAVGGNRPPTEVVDTEWINRLSSAAIVIRKVSNQDRVTTLRQLVAPALHKGDTAMVLGLVADFIQDSYRKVQTFGQQFPSTVENMEGPLARLGLAIVPSKCVEKAFSQLKSVGNVTSRK